MYKLLKEDRRTRMRRARIHFKRKEKRKIQRGGWELARECSLVEAGWACYFEENGGSVPLRAH